jgi:hypothetical protein
MKKRLGKIHMAAMVSAALFASFAGFAYPRAMGAMACDCSPPGSAREEFQRMDAVFSGEVISLGLRSAKAEFKVEKVWKGPSAKKIALKYIGSDCTYPFVVGKKYLVYASGKEILETHVCTRTKELDKASDDMKVLGEGKEP